MYMWIYVHALSAGMYRKTHGNPNTICMYVHIHTWVYTYVSKFRDMAHLELSRLAVLEAGLLLGANEGVPHGLFGLERLLD